MLSTINYLIMYLLGQQNNFDILIFLRVLEAQCLKLFPTKLIQVLYQHLWCTRLHVRLSFPLASSSLGKFYVNAFLMSWGYVFSYSLPQNTRIFVAERADLFTFTSLKTTCKFYKWIKTLNFFYLFYVSINMEPNSNNLNRFARSLL